MGRHKNKAMSRQGPVVEENAKNVFEDLRERNVFEDYRSCRAVARKALTGLFLLDNTDPEVGWRKDERTERIRFMPVESEAGGLPDPSLQFLKQKGKSDEVTVIDSCNGLLLCINKAWGSNAKTMFVCNPLTKEKIAIPNSKKPSQRVAYALIADLDCDCLKYKVLCLLRSENCGDGYSQLSTLSSETGEWVEVSDELPPARYGFRSGSRVFLNGTLYWDCIEGHILVCHLNVSGQEVKEPCYSLIKVPGTAVARCLWKSEEKLHCYFHGAGEEFPEWTLCVNAGEEPIEWKHEDLDRFGNLSDDVESFTGLTITKKKPGSEFKIISYAPESETFLIYISNEIYMYQWKERALEFRGGFVASSVQSHCCVLPYTHTLVRFDQAAKGGAINGGDSEEASEMKKFRGRRNKRRPTCQDFSTED